MLRARNETYSNRFSSPRHLSLALNFFDSSRCFSIARDSRENCIFYVLRNKSDTTRLRGTKVRIHRVLAIFLTGTTDTFFLSKFYVHALRHVFINLSVRTFALLCALLFVLLFIESDFCYPNYLRARLNECYYVTHLRSGRSFKSFTDAKTSFFDRFVIDEIV